MNQEIQTALDKAVLGLFIRPTGSNRPSTFLSTFYCAMTVIWDPTIPTASVNGWMELRINPDWYMGRSAAMRETILAHEIWHVALFHVDAARMGNRDPDLWNWACDQANNNMLFEHDFTFDKNVDGSFIGVLDRRFANMTAEEIYQIALDENLVIDLAWGKDFTTGNAGGGYGPGRSDPNDLPPIDDAQRQTILATVIRGLTLTQMDPEQMRGMPGNLTTMVEQLLNPRLPWNVLLQRYLTALHEQAVSWRLPNRRYADVYLPGRAKDSSLSHVRWYADVSGSVHDAQLRAYFSEIKGAKETFNPERMTVCTFDTAIRDRIEYTREDDVEEIEVHGRGSTDLNDVMDDIRKHKPDVAIIISDLDVHIPEEDPGVRILWICVDNPNRPDPPYGTVIHLDSTPSTTP